MTTVNGRAGLLVVAVLASSCGCSGRSDIGFGGGGGNFSFPDAGGFSCSSDAGPVDTDAVVSPQVQPPPISGGTLAVMADGTLVAADSDRDLVWIVGPAQTAATEVRLSQGDEPGRAIEGPLGRAFVALRRAGAVAEVNVATRRVVAVHAACPAPRGLGWLPSSNTLVVACATGSLARLKFDVGSSALTLLERKLSHPAEDLRDVVVKGDTVLVSTFRDARIFHVTSEDLTLELALPSHVEFLKRQVAWRMVGTSAGALMVHQMEATQFVGGGSCGGSSYGLNGFFGVDAGQTGIIGTALTAVGGASPEQSVALAALPVDLAVSPGGEWAVAAAGANKVFRSGAGELEFSAQPTAVAFHGPRLVVFFREPSALVVIEPTGARTTIPLVGVSVASTAHGLFHRATAAQLACASCHPEGRDDGHTWQLPEGARRTNSLLGGLKASAPFHWGGDRATIAALMDDVMVQRMGGSPQSPARTDALLNWLDQLPAMPLPDNLDFAAVARGKIVFDSPAAKCSSCHAGPLGTDNRNSDVGTGGPFQSPRLVGLASRAPYLHDGRMGRLSDRFAQSSGGEAHGSTGSLSPTQRADLVEYLRSR